jgi:biotin carboxylase
MGDGVVRRHIVVLHRWRARYAEYERYVDHERETVTYITTEVGADGVPPAAAEVVIVPATDDAPAVRAQLRALAARHGAPAAIVALKEDDLLLAAELRAEWGCPGPTVAELLPFRDKLVMAQRVAAAGIAAPAFADAPDRAAVRAFAREHGWPVVVKPRIGSSSEGVAVLSGPRALETATVANAMVQTFDSGRVHHVDGVFDGQRLGLFRVSRYVDTCLSFRSGTPLGSVELDDLPTVARVGAFAERVLRALSGKPLVFHLEVFVHQDDCTFLEVGARAGGAEIPFVWRELHGYDLMAAGFRIALGERPPRKLARRPAEVGGWLLAPAPATRPCRILEATPMVGRLPGPYAETVLARGEILPAADAYYEHVGGRFRFRGSSTAAVAEAIDVTARDFRVRAAAVPETRSA